jgi:hypothetical protein
MNLFPCGYDAYDGEISIHEYLKFRVSSLFSLFTLYKPYLLIMYDIQQFFQLIKHTYNMILENNIKFIRRKNPKIIDVKILRHIIKYRLPSSIQGSPTWH